MIRMILTQAVVSLAAFLQAKSPEFGAIFPGGGQRGSTFEITTTITNKPVSQWWTGAPGITFGATDKPDKWKVTISEETPLGLYPIVRKNSEGVSATRWFSVGGFHEIVEKEPNNGLTTRQKIDSLPVCVNARLGEVNDVDHFHVSLKAGQTLVTMVEAYSIGSAVDMMAHILGPDGKRVFTASDHRNLDPFFAFTASVDGDYTVQIAGFAHPPQANVNYVGGAAIVYRLHLTTRPVVTHFHPFAFSPEHPTPVTLQGYNLDPAKREVTIAPKSIRQVDGKHDVDLPDTLFPLQALCVPQVPSIEREPNDSRDQAMIIQEGFVGGCIDGEEDQDRFAIEMRKGMKLQAAIHSAALGLTLDASLRVEGPDGKQLAENDDYDGKPDPRVTWTAPVDGFYQIVVRDTLQRGGEKCHYVLRVSPPQPSVMLTLAAPQKLSVEAGETTSVKFAVKRIDGWNKPFVARVSGLPGGITSPEVNVGEKDPEVEIRISAAKDAVAGNHLLSFSAVPSRVSAEERTAPHPSPVMGFPASVSLRGDTVRGSSLLDSTDMLWLSVLPVKESSTKASSHK